MLELERDGAQLFPQALERSDLVALEAILPPSDRPGERIYNSPKLATWISTGPVGPIVRHILGEETRPVRAILFDKSPQTNWSLGWHQDRTIAVREQVEAKGFAHWNRKAGANHVEPPFVLIERMVTARIHIDQVTPDKAPLLIAPGSHRTGRISEGEIDAVVAACGTLPCTANAGDVWLYRTAILHASERSTSSGRRRVLQVDFAAEDLPGGLQWLGVA